MVGRLLKVLNREWGGLHEAAFLLAGTALLSQALGLVRDRLLTTRFGAGESLDIYYAAFRIPDFLYASLASFVAVTVLIPFLLRRMESEEGISSARKFIDSVFTIFCVMMVLASAAAYVCIPFFAHYVVPGFSEEKLGEFILLSRLLLLSPFLLGISNLFGSVTQSLRRFFVFAAGPILYNLGIIFGIIFLLPQMGLRGVVLGVLIGATLHVMIQIPVLISERLLPRFTHNIHWEDLRAMVKLSVPRTIALSATNIAAMVLIGLASQMETGSIAVFTLAMNLQNIPLSIVGMSYSVAAFPTLAKLWNGGNSEQFLQQIIGATRHIVFWSFPAIVLFIVLRAQIVRSVLGAGAFDWTATRLVAAALALFAISIVAQNLAMLYTRSFYAMGKTALPLRANAIGGVLIISSSFFLLFAFREYPTFRFFAETLLRVGDIPGTQILMLPLGYSIGMIVNMFMHLFMLQKFFPTLRRDAKKAFLHSFSTSVLMGFVAYHSLQAFALVLNINTFLGVFIQGALSGLIGICAGIFLLRIMENRELEEIHSSLHHKFWKSKPIVTEQGGI
jgi:putative peptidoglycan lipid II flippase